MAHSANRGSRTTGRKNVNRIPDKNDPTYPLRTTTHVKRASRVVLPSAPVLMGEFILEPDILTLIISESWESGPGSNTLIFESWEDEEVSNGN